MTSRAQASALTRESAATQNSGAATKPQPWRQGDRVVHRFSGWTGTVRYVLEDDGGMGQGPLVTVTEVRAGTPHVWKDITVTSDELDAIDAQARTLDGEPPRKETE